MINFPAFWGAGDERARASKKRGTHFEKDPMKGKSNLFSDNPETTPPEDAPGKSNEPKVEPKTNLPVSQASAAPSPDSEAPEGQVQPQTTAAPQQTPVSTSTTDDKPVNEPTELPPPKIVPPAEKEANKTAIKAMLKGDDYMLEQVADFVRFNAPHIMEEIKKKLYERH